MTALTRKDWKILLRISLTVGASFYGIKMAYNFIVVMALVVPFHLSDQLSRLIVGGGGLIFFLIVAKLYLRRLLLKPAGGYQLIIPEGSRNFNFYLFFWILIVIGISTLFEYVGLVDISVLLFVAGGASIIVIIALMKIEHAAFEPISKVNIRQVESKI